MHDVLSWAGTIAIWGGGAIAVLAGGFCILWLLARLNEALPDGKQAVTTQQTQGRGRAATQKEAAAAMQGRGRVTALDEVKFPGHEIVDSPAIFLGAHYDRTTGRTGLPNTYEGPLGVLLFGLSGAGKFTRLLSGILLTITGRSVVCIDVKGELAAVTSRFRRSVSDVLIIDPFGPYSDGFNPLAWLDPDGEDLYRAAARLAEAMIKIEGNDPHWPESAQGLVEALIMWEVKRAAKEKRVPSLGNVRAMLTEADEWEAGSDGKDHLVKGLRVTAGRMIAEGGYEIISLAGRFLDETNEIKSIQSTADTQTKWLLDPALRADLSKNGVDFSRLKEHPTTVYIVVPAAEITFASKWLRLVITSALRAQMKPGGLSTLFILDEFYAALGHLKIIEEVWALVRGYRIQLMPVIQSVTQLQKLFNDAWENFMAQAGVVLTIGPPNDKPTAEWMSWRSATKSVTQQSFNESSGWGGGSGNSSKSTNYQEIDRPVLSAQELMDTPTGHGWMWVQGWGEHGSVFPFFAPNYWHLKKLDDRADPNPYQPSAMPTELPPAADGRPRRLCGSGSR